MHQQQHPPPAVVYQQPQPSYPMTHMDPGRMIHHVSCLSVVHLLAI